jgi:hypothetical protein
MMEMKFQRSLPKISKHPGCENAKGREPLQIKKQKYIPMFIL